MSTNYVLGRSNWRSFRQGIEKEWLLTNGIGGFANQTIIGANSRIHSGYLIASFNPPSDRYTILSNTYETIIIDNKEYELATQEYIGTFREGQKYLNRFELDILPTYTYQVKDLLLKKTISLEHGKNTVTVCYEITNGLSEAEFKITPLFNCKESNQTIEKSKLKFETNLDGNKLNLKFDDTNIYFYTSSGYYYDRSKKPTSMATPNYIIEENQVYHIDNRNGFLGVDNHYTPYDICLKLSPFETKKMFIKCSVEELDEKDGFVIAKEYKKRVTTLMDKININDDFAKKLAWSADNFIVNRNSTNLKTVLAGYPWFLDWGRDTMIALQGLTLCTQRFEDNKSILKSFSKYIKDGMIPNVFPNNAKDKPAYNTIDASLWYFYSVYKYLEYTGEQKDYDFVKQEIYPCLKEIINSYKAGTNFNINMDSDGLIQGGSDLDQLTWMDVRVGDWVVTPRHGKAVEVNALWYNALHIMYIFSKKFECEDLSYKLLFEKVKNSFCQKFWNEKGGYLYDTISVNKLGEEIKDDKIRPNQIWAVSLPFHILDINKEKSIVQIVYKYLYTPYGIRSLVDTDKDYKGQYIGKLIKRDASYHMGTAWGYISGAFISAYCKVNNHSKEAVNRAKEMCLYFQEHMNDGCLNGIAEIFDGDFACTGRGCYSQAWSVGEILRAYTEDVLPYSVYL